MTFSDIDDAEVVTVILSVPGLRAAVTVVCSEAHFRMSAVVEPFTPDTDELKCDDILNAPNAGSGDGDGLSGGGPSAGSARAAYLHRASQQEEEASELDVSPHRRNTTSKLKATVRNIGSLQMQHKRAKVGRTRVIHIHGAAVVYSADDADDEDGDGASSAGEISAADVAQTKALAAAVLSAPGDGTASGGARPSALRQHQLKGLLQTHARASAQGVAAARSIAESGGVGFEEEAGRAKLHGPSDWMLSPVQRMPWDLFLVTLLVYIMIALPYRLCFDHEARGAMAILELTIDCCFLVDVRALGDARSRATAAAAVVVTHFSLSEAADGSRVSTARLTPRAMDSHARRRHPSNGRRASFLFRCCSTSARSSSSRTRAAPSSASTTRSTSRRAI